MEVSPQEAMEATPKQRRAYAVRRRLQEAALQLFGARGYEATTVADIADAADISERTFFRYFRSKEDVLFEAPERRIETAQQLMASIEPAGSDWDIILRALADYARFMDANSDLVRPTAEVIYTIAELRARRALMRDRWAEGLASALAGRRGGQTPTFDDLTLTAAATAIFETLVRRWVMSKDEGDLADLVEEALKRFEPSESRAA